MPDVSIVSTLLLGSSGLLTGVLALLSSRSNRGKVNSETDVNMTNAEQSREKLYQSREEFWRNEMHCVKCELARELTELKNHIAAVHTLIETHVLWDWEVVRQLKLDGIDFRDPPTLNYIKPQPEEK